MNIVENIFAEAAQSLHISAIIERAKQPPRSGKRTQPRVSTRFQTLGDLSVKRRALKGRKKD